MKTRIEKPKIFLIALVALLLPLQGCVNFGAVRDFAALSSQSTKGFAGIVEDTHESCVRAASFDADIAARCSQLKDLQPQLIKAHAVLQQYMETLNKLADDQVVSYDKSLDSLGKELAGSQVFNKDQASALTGLAKALAKIATDGYRRRQISQVIQATNSDFQVVTIAFRDIVGSDYARLLQNESIAMRSYYMTQINSHKKNEPLAAELADRTMKERNAQIENKKQAVASYVKIMESISKAHQDLFDHRKDLGSKEVMKLMWDYGKTLAPLVKDVQKAF